MSKTGTLQELARRGLTLHWSTAPGDDPDYDGLTLEIRSAGGAVMSRILHVKARGAVSTKESEEARRDELIRWAEELTRHGVPEAGIVESVAPPEAPSASPEEPVAPDAVTTDAGQEGGADGEEVVPSDSGAISASEDPSDRPA